MYECRKQVSRHVASSCIAVARWSSLFLDVSAEKQRIVSKFERRSNYNANQRIIFEKEGFVSRAIPNSEPQHSH
jgi:hypothetical protein